ncbi:MAG: DUF6495 family protein [Candidatus Cyclobacteriaceae bacterium M2_1C_046]
MTKYRKLTLDELQHLEKEFVEYLVINGITADEWVKIKEDEKEKAERIIELFSDVVFEDILRKARYLDFRSTKEIYSYQCLADKIVMVALTADPQSDIDFSNEGSVKKAMDQSSKLIRIFTTDKPYHKQREVEIFNMLESGCEISDGKLFKTLCLAL